MRDLSKDAGRDELLLVRLADIVETRGRAGSRPYRPGQSDSVIGHHKVRLLRANSRLYAVTMGRENYHGIYDVIIVGAGYS